MGIVGVLVLFQGLLVGLPPEPEPEWKPAKTPFVDFFKLVREMPDFGNFPSGTDGIELSMVVHDKSGLIFLDSCKAIPTKQGWQVEGCRAVRLKQGEFLARLVAAGTDTSARPGSLKSLVKILKKARKARKLEQLVETFLEAARENPKAYSIMDDVKGDIAQCGSKRYFSFLSTLPEPRYVGASTVVIDLSYTGKKKGRPYKVKASLAKTKQGWRIGALRVYCYQP